MPMPVTRPFNSNQTEDKSAALHRPSGAPTVTLPPSNGMALPYGQGVVHTVKNPAHTVPTPSKVPTPARVS